MPTIKVLPGHALCPAGAEVEARAGVSICDTLLANHIDIEHACEKQAACTTCHVIVREGFDSLDITELLMELEEGGGVPCRPVHPSGGQQTGHLLLRVTSLEGVQLIHLVYLVPGVAE